MQEKVTLPEDLLFKYLKGELKKEDQVKLDEWLAKGEQNRILFEDITNDKNLAEELKKFRSSNPDAIKAKLVDFWPSAIVTPVRRFIWLKITAAAAVLVLASAAYFIMFRKDKRESLAKTENVNTPAIDKAPGKDGAILKLANGQEIVLDSAGNGLVVLQGKSEIVKKDGLLSYSSSVSNGEVFYNTLTTRRGRQFQLMLPDGSRVWLNAESSITYPTAFTVGERMVTVQGELYMEVAKDASRPFRIKVTDGTLDQKESTTIEVLGTHFNINGYGDEPVIKTTLLEGKVKVLTGKSLALLKPGQQAQVTNNTISINSNVDIEKIVAWKNGFFSYTDDKLSEVMRDLERWYDLDVIYENNIRDIKFSGDIHRNSNLSEVVKILHLLKIEARIEGRKLILKENKS